MQMARAQLPGSAARGLCGCCDLRQRIQRSRRAASAPCAPRNRARALQQCRPWRDRAVPTPEPEPRVARPHRTPAPCRIGLARYSSAQAGAAVAAPEAEDAPVSRSAV